MTDSSAIDGTQLIVGIGPGTWNDIEKDIDVAGRLIRVTLLPEGTALGHPSVELLIETADGGLVHANTTWALWQGATNVFGSHESTWET